MFFLADLCSWPNLFQSLQNLNCFLEPFSSVHTSFHKTNQSLLASQLCAPKQSIQVRRLMLLKSVSKALVQYSRKKILYSRKQNRNTQERYMGESVGRKREAILI